MSRLWRDPRNWAWEEGGRPLRHLHIRSSDHVIVCGVDGHKYLDLRGMPGVLEVRGYTGTLRMPDGSRISLNPSRWARVRGRIRRELVPVVPPAFVAAVDAAGGWRRTVLDRRSALRITRYGITLSPVMAGGAAALVKSGAVSTVPAFGQNTTAGNLLVGRMTALLGAASGNFTCSDGTWTLAVQDVARANVQTAIFYKPNCGATETAPTFSYSGAGATLHGVLSEFSGIVKVSPLDQSGHANAAGTSAPAAGASPAVNCAAPNAANGALVVTADAISFGSSTTITSSDTYNQGATPTENLNADSTSTRQHYRFAYGITTTHSGASTNSPSDSNTGTGDVISGCIATFKLAAAAVTAADTGVTASDSLVSARTHLISVTGLTVSDSLATVRVRAVSDTGLAVSDSVASVRVRAVTDTGLTVTDSLVRSAAGAVTDTGLTVTDSLARLVLRVVADTGLAVSDSTQKSAVHLVADTGLAVSDSTQKSATHFLADTGLTESDSISASTGDTRSIADTGLTITDSLARSSSQALTDTGLTISDSTRKLVVHLIAATGLTVTDAIQRQTSDQIALTDTGLAISDAVASSTSRTLSLTDIGLTISDSLGRGSVSVSITDTGLTITDSLRIPDVPGFASGTDVPAYAAASAVVVTDRAEGTDFATYGSTIIDQPGGLP